MWAQRPTSGGFLVSSLLDIHVSSQPILHVTFQMHTLECVVGPGLGELISSPFCPVFASEMHENVLEI